MEIHTLAGGKDTTSFGQNISLENKVQSAESI